MALTGKQVRQLRALAHHLNPVVHIGKADVTDAIAKQAEEALDAHELIKCSVQDGSLLSCREAADQLAELVGAEVVQVSATVSPCIVRAAVRTSSTSSSVKTLPAAGRTNAPPPSSLTHQEAHHRVRLLFSHSNQSMVCIPDRPMIDS